MLLEVLLRRLLLDGDGLAVLKIAIRAVADRLLLIPFVLLASAFGRYRLPPIGFVSMLAAALFTALAFSISPFVSFALSGLGVLAGDDGASQGCHGAACEAEQRVDAGNASIGQSSHQVVETFPVHRCSVLSCRWWFWHSRRPTPSAAVPRVQFRKSDLRVCEQPRLPSGTSLWRVPE